jgi:hypothetical protein
MFIKKSLSPVSMLENQLKYPRKPGEVKSVQESEWEQKAAYGICPACGNIGIEELAIPGDSEAAFYCPDVECKTTMGHRAPARTKWNMEKPEEFRMKELTGWSWNAQYFPGQDLSDICLD